MSEYKCPYGGYGVAIKGRLIMCGDHGTLCQHCREDRADRRTRALVKAVLFGFDTHDSDGADAEARSWLPEEPTHE